MGKKLYSFGDFSRLAHTLVTFRYIHIEHMHYSRCLDVICTQLTTILINIYIYRNSFHMIQWSVSLLVWLFSSLLGSNQDKGSEIHTIKREEANSKTADVQQNMPELSVSCFVPCSDTAITATFSGDVVVWKEQR